MDADRAEQAGITSPRGPRRPLARICGSVLAVGLIGLWVAWWAASERADSMVLARVTWVPPLAFLAGDFKVHIDHVARRQARGIDPYRDPDDWVCCLYPYPPMIGRSFVWVSLMSQATAARAWLVALALLFAAGAIASWRTRRALGLSEIPLVWLVVAVLFATPTLFAMERGQIDPMVVLPLIVASWLLVRQGAGADVVAGALLGVAAWLKYYPGLTFVALVALRRPKALAGFVVVAAVIGLVDFDGFRQSIKNGALAQVVMADKVPHVHEIKHSIVENWKSMKFVRRVHLLGEIPGSVAASALLLPAVVLVSRRVSRAPDPRPLILPFLLWLTAASTFGMPYANDYNLVPLLLAMLAVWDVGDSWRVQMLLGLSMLWFQPFWLPLGGQILMVLKLLALYGVGWSLASRAVGSNSAVPVRELSSPRLIRSTSRPHLVRDRLE
jgi:hypothetical protein